MNENLSDQSFSTVSGKITLKNYLGDYFYLLKFAQFRLQLLQCGVLIRGFLLYSCHCFLNIYSPVQSCSKNIKDLHFGKLNTGSFSFKVVFLMSFSLSLLCSCQDPSIAKNPGPYTPKPFPHGSPEEKRLFLSLRKLNDDLIKLKSHATFLQNCLNNDIIPDGLPSSLPNAVAKPDDNLQYKLELLGNSNSFNTMKVIISHYKVQILKLTEEIHSTKQQPSDLTTSNRFTFLLPSLNHS